MACQETIAEVQTTTDAHSGASHSQDMQPNSQKGKKIESHSGQDRVFLPALDESYSASLSPALLSRTRTNGYEKRTGLQLIRSWPVN